jgi:hypothetical protein
VLFSTEGHHGRRSNIYFHLCWSASYSLILRFRSWKSDVLILLDAIVRKLRIHMYNFREQKYIERKNVEWKAISEYYWSKKSFPGE